MDCRHNTTNTFSIFVTTYLVPQEEIRKKANLYQNSLSPDGTPKARSRHKVEGKYNLTYLRDKIVDDELKRKFEAIRRQLKETNPELQEEYTKRRLVYWNSSNQCIYTLEPHRKTLWLGIVGKSELEGYRKYFDHNKTYFRIKGDTNIENILRLCS